jgi:DNA replication and repair protein RecF
LRFLVDGTDMTTYGSRGQQRTIALSLKLAEVELMTQVRDDEPVLLLDDVISELDADRRSYLLDTVAGASQVIVTTSDLLFYGSDFLSGVTLWNVCAGRVREVKSGSGAVC